MDNILETVNLNISFRSGGTYIPVVNGFSFSVKRGEILALVGESGCGKSIICLSLTGLLPYPKMKAGADAMLFRPASGNAVDLNRLPPPAMRKIRGGKIAYVFQEPSASLNPVFRVGEQVAEVIRLHRRDCRDVRSETVSLFRQVGIPAPEERINAFPHELSGGMQQRVMIAMALAGNPELLIADEPTTALDVTVQAQILELISGLCRGRGMSVILVTHNLGIVARYADSVAVMYAGMAAESGPAGGVLSSPAHPYTSALLNAVPKLGGTSRLESIPGRVPAPADFGSGCRFAPRCGRCAAAGGDSAAKCMNTVPPPADLGGGRKVYCHIPAAGKESGI